MLWAPPASDNLHLTLRHWQLTLGRSTQTPYLSSCSSSCLLFYLYNKTCPSSFSWFQLHRLFSPKHTQAHFNVYLCTYGFSSQILYFLLNLTSLEDSERIHLKYLHGYHQYFYHLALCHFYILFLFFVHSHTNIKISFVGAIYCLSFPLEYKLNKEKDLFTSLSPVSKSVPGIEDIFNQHFRKEHWHKFGISLLIS